MTHSFIGAYARLHQSYDLSVDVTEWNPCPMLYPLEDGQVIDLGKHRVTVYACPEHTPGIALHCCRKGPFLSQASERSRLCRNWRGGCRTAVQPPLDNHGQSQRSRIYAHKYARCYNGRYHFRKLGKPPGGDGMHDAIIACEQIAAVTARVELHPPWNPKFPAKPNPLPPFCMIVTTG